jgi:hypothetical protein
MTKLLEKVFAKVSKLPKGKRVVVTWRSRIVCACVSTSPVVDEGAKAHPLHCTVHRDMQALLVINNRHCGSSPYTLQTT